MSELRHRLKTLRGFVSKRADGHNDLIKSNLVHADREARVDECRILIAEIDRMLTFKATGRPKYPPTDVAER